MAAPAAFPKCVIFLAVVLCVGSVPTPKESKTKQQSEIKKLSIVELDPSWPVPTIRSSFGAIGGVSIGPLGNSYIFHRADRTWDIDDFNEKFSYVRAKFGTIESDPIIVLDPESNVLFTFGRGMFYLPHGITVDDQGNVWVTDVALHQVLKFEAGKGKPTLSLGESLIPGSDNAHFCQPTAVAVATKGDFFVADGYCNSRIMKFAENGTLVKKWGRKRKGKEPLANDHLSIPHGLALAEAHDLICVADREHQRVVCFHAGLKHPQKTGEFAFNITSPDMGRPYDVKYNELYDVILVLATNKETSRGYVFSLKDRRLINYFDNPATRGFGDGHTLASAPNGQYLIVGSLTYQCPDITHPQCRFEGSVLDQNLWRFYLHQERSTDFSEEELNEIAKKRQQEEEERSQLFDLEGRYE